MNPKQYHREELKIRGFKEEVIEELVMKYTDNFIYDFADFYHQHKLNEMNKENEILIKSLKKALEDANSLLIKISRSK
jgi:hypothetical protein